MKKFFTAVLCAGLIAVTASGCGYSDALLDSKSSVTQPSEANSNPATEDEVKSSDYKNDLNGLVDYFVAKEYIKDDKNTVTEMDAASIGAEKGKKFANTFEAKNITIELYEYNQDKLNETAENILESVKKDGTFSIYSLPDVPAYISDNGKFLMIYTDASIDNKNADKTSPNFQHREEVIEDFKAFNN